MLRKGFGVSVPSLLPIFRELAFFVFLGVKTAAVESWHGGKGAKWITHYGQAKALDHKMSFIHFIEFNIILRILNFMSVR